MKTTDNNTQLTSKRPADSATKSRRQSAWLAARPALAIALLLVTFASVAIPAAAQDEDKGARPEVTFAKLKGTWLASMYGQGGCGVGTKLLSITFNSSGVATDVSDSYHTVSCGNDTILGLTFTITSLNSTGTGFATLSGSGPTLNYAIQVSQNSQMMTLVDITDSGNYEEGSAVKQ
jgi:hypothetical protein